MDFICYFLVAAYAIMAAIVVIYLVYFHIRWDDKQEVYFLEKMDEREKALLIKQQTGKVLYLYDDSGNEFWYSEKDTKKHYTREEG